MSQPIKGQGGQLGFLIGPKYTNLVEDIEVLVPFMFRCIPFSDFRDKNEKYLSQLEARAAILDFGSARKTQTGKRTLRSRFLSSFVCNPFSSFRDWEEVENVSANQRPGRPYLISDRHEKHKLSRQRWYIPSCPVSLYSVKRFQKKKSKMSQQIRGQDGDIGLPIGPKKITNLVEDVEILLHIKFRWITFKEEVENVKS